MASDIAPVMLILCKQTLRKVGSESKVNTVENFSLRHYTVSLHFHD